MSVCAVKSVNLEAKKPFPGKQKVMAHLWRSGHLCFGKLISKHVKVDTQSTLCCFARVIVTVTLLT